MTFKIISLVITLSFMACNQPKNQAVAETPEVKNTAAPSFDADSAYSYIEKQTLFGPRVPNSDAHKACAAYLAGELKRFGATVTEQRTTLKAWNGTPLESVNIIGSFNPENPKRILLVAHWDSRPYSDEDKDPANHHKPVMGADDGGSGVGVLLEIARQIGMKAPDTGIDIIFFDAEDYGIPDFYDGSDIPGDWWCLGSQYWAKNPHVPGYKADFGILLDMVGTKNATFFKEGTSMRYAPNIVEKVWSKARSLGYGKYFIQAKIGGITDDHQFVNQGRGVPCIDILNYDPDNEKGFGDYWHTQNDTMDNIDRETLKAVGQTVMEIVYEH